MRIIRLTKGKVSFVDNADYDLVSQFKYYPVGNPSNQYAMRWDKRNHYYLHWDILGKPLNGFWVDHINGNALDNRRSNLRVCTPSQNHQNKTRMKKKGSTSLFKGVCFRKNINKWISSIHVKGKYLYLGSFSTELGAVLAYNAAAQKHFGYFAKLNTISTGG